MPGSDAVGMGRARRGATHRPVGPLRRAFFHAGTRALRVTNRSVHSASARELVGDLFRRQAKDPRITRGEVTVDARAHRQRRFQGLRREDIIQTSSSAARSRQEAENRKGRPFWRAYPHHSKTKLVSSWTYQRVIWHVRPFAIS